MSAVGDMKCDNIWSQRALTLRFQRPRMGQRVQICRQRCRDHRIYPKHEQETCYWQEDLGLREIFSGMPHRDMPNF